MSFWDVVWFIFISFAFVAYLMVLFSILSDLFRDRDTSGVVKAIWVVALIIFPLVTSLIYLIARGGGMTDRSMQASERQRVQQEAHPGRRPEAVVGSRPDRPGEGAARRGGHLPGRVRHAQAQGAGLIGHRPPARQHWSAAQ